jgi:uncharacterized protein YndB with AHSA1/START domain
MVYDHGGYDDRPPLFRVDVKFAEVNGKTSLEMRMILATAEVAEQTRIFIKKAGGNATWDRLGEYLEKQSSGLEKFIINRSFAAPVEQLFEMWTNPKQVAKWLPPTGFTMEFIRADIRQGGSTFFSMTNGNDITFYVKSEYLKLEKPRELIYTQQFCEADGKVSRHPLAPLWPETMLCSVKLTAEDEQNSRVTVTCEPYQTVTQEEIQAFADARMGMTSGWSGSFDKLEELMIAK